jgi:uroporphyrinogen decarboxylase
MSTHLDGITGIDEISGRKRILAAFEHREVDRIPVFDVANNPELFLKGLGQENHWSDGAPTVKLAKKLGLDAAMVPVGSYTALIKKERTWIDDTTFLDRFGVKYTVSSSSWPLGIAIEEVALDEKFAGNFKAQATITPEDLQPVKDAVCEAHTGKRDEIAIFAGSRSAFSHLAVSGGLVALSMLLYEDPELLHKLVELSTDYWTEVGLRLIETGVDALYIANDMGMNGSTMISPKHLREFFLPAFERQCAAWKKAGGRVILHSCGNIEAILPDLYSSCQSNCQELIPKEFVPGDGGSRPKGKSDDKSSSCQSNCQELIPKEFVPGDGGVRAETGGIDGLNNLQSHAGMDIASVKERFGDKWTLIGNVDATTVMTSERKEDIDEAIAAVIKSAGSNGGLILATDHSFHKGIPIENVYHFIEQAKRLGTYQKLHQPQLQSNSQDQAKIDPGTYQSLQPQLQSNCQDQAKIDPGTYTVESDVGNCGESV